MARLAGVLALAYSSADSPAMPLSLRHIGERKDGRGISGKRSLRAARSKRSSPAA